MIFFFILFKQIFKINSLCSLIIHIFTLLRFRNEEERKTTTKTVIKQVYHPLITKKVIIGKKVHGRTIDIKANPFFRWKYCRFSTIKCKIQVLGGLDQCLLQEIRIFKKKNSFSGC